MLTVTEQGLYCEAGDFHVDPRLAVERAVITHAHSDHARPGCRSYLCARPGAGVLRLRLGPNARIESAAYGETVQRNGVSVSFHPAGHILGSSQIRVEHRGEIWVVSGDFKTGSDSTCAGFEPVPCHTFITECTFGLPIYRWPEPSEVFADIHAWWNGNQQAGRTSVLFGYSLGKAQRILAGLDANLGPIFVHPAIEPFLDAYKAAGIALPRVETADASAIAAAPGQAMLIAPPAGTGAPWFQELGDVATASASGWMQVRKFARRGSVERGFALSDHADWPGLLDAIRATGARRILATHGSTGPLVRWLNENGWDAAPLASPRRDPNAGVSDVVED